MTPRKPETLFVSLILLLTITNFGSFQKQFIRQIRHNRFFVINSLSGATLPQNGTLYKDGKKIGNFHMLMKQSTQILFQLYTDQPLLDEKCYIIAMEKPNPPQADVITEAAISSLKVDQFLFVKKDKIFITRDPISLNHIGNVDNLTGFLQAIEKKTQSKYRANIPKAKEIIRNPSHFYKAMEGKFIICNIQNRFGYAYLEDDEIITKPVLKETINKLKNKFYFYIVLK